MNTAEIISKVMMTLYLRWLKTVSNTLIFMGCYNYYLSLDATIVASKNRPTIGEHVVYHFCDTIGYHSISMTS